MEIHTRISGLGMRLLVQGRVEADIASSLLKGKPKIAFHMLPRVERQTLPTQSSVAQIEQTLQFVIVPKIETKLAVWSLIKDLLYACSTCPSLQ